MKARIIKRVGVDGHTQFIIHLSTSSSAGYCGKTPCASVSSIPIPSAYLALAWRKACSRTPRTAAIPRISVT